MIRKILIYPNAKKDQRYACTQEVISFLQARGIEIYAPAAAVTELSIDSVRPIREADKSNMDLAIVLGGDGSMIQGAHFLLGTAVPILGVNLGTLGYLTEVEPANLKPLLEQAVSGNFQVENRLMLEAEVVSAEGGKRQRFWAVNDFVIHRNLLDGILSFKTYVNHALLAEFRADGVIIASPCGSTAYNFSAGGPILNPVADNLVLTPLCSHAMLDRSVILMGQDRLSFQIGPSAKGQKAMFSADGKAAATLSEGSWIYIQKSQYTFPLVRLLQRSFYEVLQRKMRP